MATNGLTNHYDGIFELDSLSWLPQNVYGCSAKSQKVPTPVSGLPRDGFPCVRELLEVMSAPAPNLALWRVQSTQYIGGSDAAGKEGRESEDSRR